MVRLKLFILPEGEQLVITVHRLVADHYSFELLIEEYTRCTWFFKQQLNWNHYNQSVMLYKPGGFDVRTLTHVFDHITNQHDMLRAIYHMKEGKITQEIQAPGQHVFELEALEIYETDSASRIEKEARRMQASLNINDGPLIRLGLFHTNDGDHLLIIVHHLLIDGVSWRVLFEDFITGYTQALKGEAIQLPAKTTSYATWTQALTEYRTSYKLKREAAYWDEIDAIMDQPLSKDKQTDQRQMKSYRTIDFDLSQELSNKAIKDVPQAYQTEINDLLLAALGLSLHGWSTSREMVLHMEGHGREDIIQGLNLQRTVGWFTSLFPVVIDISGTKDLGQYLKETKERLRKIPHKGIGYGILSYQAQQDVSKPEIVFNYLGQFDHEIQTDVFQISNLSTGEVISPDAEAWYNIAFEGMMRQGKLSFEIRYNSDAYHESTIKAWSDRFITCLEDLIEHCIQKEESEKTPFDYGDPSLDLEELASIQANIEGEYESIYRLTPMQEGMLYHTLLDSQSTAYFEQFAFWVEESLDSTCLERSYIALMSDMMYFGLNLYTKA